jgi:UDP-GlcNAc:undecaprenyl-phosphate/decaprenyl-phosphate GlcNAc-1-phosphate transferase
MKLVGSDYFLLFGSSFALVGLLTPGMRKIALKFGVVDRPGESHKTHRRPIPYLGGLAIALGVTIVAYGTTLLSRFSTSNFLLATSVLLPGIFLSIIGLIDDVMNLSPWPRFLAQNLVGLVSAIILISTKTLGKPTGSILLDVAITVLWIVGLTNAVNFFDNIDGGASGSVAVSALFISILAIQGNQFLIGALAIVLTGATLGFLIWNRPPARIYMGDAGSLFLGLLIASLTIRLEPNPLNQYASFAIPVLLVAVPIMDTSVVVLKRIKRGISPFQGGTDHLSHRLMRKGLSKRQAVISLWLLSLLFGLFALLLSNAPYQWEGVVAVFGSVMWLATFFFFARQADS